MDPREKREDESWAEYGVRMTSLGIAPEIATVPLAAAIRRPGRRGTGTLKTPESIAARDAARKALGDKLDFSTRQCCEERRYICTGS